MSHVLQCQHNSHHRTRLILTLIFLPACVWSQSNPAWAASTFALPATQECCSTSSRLCDPDGTLIDVERQRLVKRIEELEVKHQIECSSSKFSVQMAISLVDRMDSTQVPSGQSREERATDPLHRQWGVGSATECGGTGLLLFFSIRDRAFLCHEARLSSPH